MASVTHDPIDAITRQYSPEHLDLELGRRRLFPPQMFDGDRWEITTVAALRQELEHTPIDDSSYRWRCFELALAERQAHHFPQMPFRRVITIGKE
jgi:hypothetical protein